MNVFIACMIIILNFIIQSTLLQYFRIFGIIPNTSLIIIIVFSILWGKNKGAIIGFSVGIMQDILLGNLLGANALIYMLIGYTVGIYERKIFKDSYLTPIFFTSIATVTYHLMFYILMYMMHNKISLAVLFKNVIWLETIYNAGISLFIYKLIYHLVQYPNRKVRLR